MKLYSTQEFANLLGVSVITLKRWRKSGKLKPVSTSINGYSQYSPEQLVSFQKSYQPVSSKINDTTLDDTTDTTLKPVSFTNQFTKSYHRNNVVEVVSQTGDNEKSGDTNKMSPLPTKGKFMQNLNNLPEQVRTARRYFLVAADKKPLTRDWSNPAVQKSYTEINGLAGFDCTGHGVAADYVLLDFDHVLDADTGDFVNDAAQAAYESAKQSLPNCYVEKSVSNAGLHILALPTDSFKQELPKDISAGQDGTLYFDELRGKNSPKLEIFYKSRGRYCLLTGRFFRCDSTATIPCGEAVDNYLRALLAKVQDNLPQKKADAAQESIFERTEILPPNPSTSSKVPFDETAYDAKRARKMLECIVCSSLTDTEWLSVITACKNLGFSYSEVDAFNMTDLDRYDEAENRKRWDSVGGGDYGMQTLHAQAQNYGYNERDFKRQWFIDHPEQSTRKEKPKHNSSSDKSNEDTPLPPRAVPVNLRLTDKERAKLFEGDKSDLDNARRISFMFGDKIRYLSDSEQFLKFEAGVWQLNGGGRNSSLYPLATKVADKMIANAKTQGELKKAAAFKKTKNVTAAITMLKGVSEILITSKDLDLYPMLLNVKNGVIDLESGKLLPAAPELLLTKQCPVVYDPNANADIFNEFCAQILPDEATRAAVLRFLGYCLTGDVREEKALFIVGSGRNGKGTLFKTVMNMLGEYATPFKIDALLARKIDKDGDAPTPEFAKLEGRRLAVANEVPADRKLDVAHFKDLTGGDALSVRRMCRESSTINNPQHKLILCGQHLPELADANDIGLRERLLVVRFTEEFTGTNCDPNLKYRLLEPAALSGALAVLTQQGLQWQREGLIVSDAMKDEKTKYLEDNDIVGGFIKDFCLRDPYETIPLSEFIKQLQSEISEARFMSYKALSKMIKKVEGITVTHQKRGNTIFGLKWIDQNKNVQGSVYDNEATQHETPEWEPIDEDNVPFD